MAKSPDTVHSVGDVSGPQEIPPSFLAKILQKLTRAGITSSARGAGGGFRLAASPDRITLLSVVEAVEGSLALNDCLVDGRACSRVDRCPAHPAWKEIRMEIMKILGKYTIRLLLERERSGRAGKIRQTGEGS